MRTSTVGISALSPDVLMSDLKRDKKDIEVL
jgi:hypothetical protein